MATLQNKPMNQATRSVIRKKFRVKVDRHPHVPLQIALRPSY